MSVTPNLSSFNKDKVANKFGIQLKPKDTNKQIVSSSSENKLINTNPSGVSKNKTVSDFRLESQSNGLESSANIQSHTKSLETMINNDASSTNHSTNVVSLRSNDATLLISCDNVQQANVASMSIDTNSNIPHTTQDSSSELLNLTPTDQQIILSTQMTKRSTIPAITPKTQAEIEHLKDQPLYKRQLSKTFENSSSLLNKLKQQHELLMSNNELLTIR